MDDITARLGLDTSPFARALRGVTGQVKAFGSNIASAIGGTVGGFIGGAALIAGAKALIDYASRLGDTADALEVTTKFLQEFNYATAQNGVDEEKSIKALSKLTLTLGEAAEGSDKARKAFSDLGVKFTNADGSLKTTEQLLKDVADAFSKSVDPAKNARLAVEIFGKEGIKLIPTLKAGSAGLAEFAKQGQKSIISEDNIAAIKALGDSLAGLGKQTMGVAGNIIGAWVRGWQGIGAYIGARSGGASPGQALDILDKMNRKVADGGAKIFPKQSEEQVKAVEKIKETYAKLKDQIAQNDAQELKGDVKLKSLNDIYQAKQKELLLEKDKVKQAEKLIELEKARNDVIKEGSDQAKERRKLEEDIKKAGQDLRIAKEDRSKFTLQDLAASPVRFTGRLEQERIGARQVVQLTNRADYLTKMGYGPQADALRNRADFIRGQLTNVVEAERFPFKVLEENSKSAALSLARLSGTVEGGQVNANGGSSGGAIKTISPNR